MQGAIVFIGSVSSQGNRGQISYASAKAGLFGLTRVTAMDLARAQITANAVAQVSLTPPAEKPAESQPAA